MNKNILWLEKYRPRTISDYIGKEDDIEIIKVENDLSLLIDVDRAYKTIFFGELF